MGFEGANVWEIEQGRAAGLSDDIAAYPWVIEPPAPPPPVDELDVRVTALEVVTRLYYRRMVSLKASQMVWLRPGRVERA